MDGPSNKSLIDPGEDEDDVESICTNVLRSLVHTVAMKVVMEQQPKLTRDLEELQRKSWAHDEKVFQRHQARAAKAGRPRVTSSSSDASAPAAAAESAVSAKPAKGRRQKDESPLAAMSGLGTSGGGSSSNGGSGRPSEYRRKQSSKGATPSASGQSVSPFTSHAESLLPATPPRSQFVFEVEKPLMIHAAVDEHRQLQRRLSMMGALEQETIKLEKQPKGAQLQIIQARSMAYPAPPLPAFH